MLTDTHIFLTGHSTEKDAYQLFVLALDRNTGKQLWQHEIPRLQPGRRENVNGPASPSPVTDGTNVYFFFQDFGLRRRYRPTASCLCARAARSITS